MPTGIRNIIFALILFWGSDSWADDSLLFVTVKGSQIISPAGQPLLLKGINLGNWLHPEGYLFNFKRTNYAPRLVDQALKELVGPDLARAFWDRYLDNYITQADIKFIKQLGFNHVRVPFNYRMFTGEEYLGRSNQGFKVLDRLIDWCRREGLGVILDMHAAPGGQTGANIDDGYGYPFLFLNEPSKVQTVHIWRKIASRYRNEPTIIGYDLLNEPIAHYFHQDLDKLIPELEPLYKRIVSAIREVDKNHIVFLGGALWNYSFRSFGPPFDSKSVYEFHKYTLDAQVNSVEIPKFQEYLDFRSKYSVPVYLGESGESSNEWIREYRENLEKNGIGWCFWTYKRMGETPSSAVVTFPIPESYQTVIDFVDGDRSVLEAVMAIRPPIDQTRRVLDKLIENLSWQHSVPQKGFVEALGLRLANQGSFRSPD